MQNFFSNRKKVTSFHDNLLFVQSDRFFFTCGMPIIDGTIPLTPSNIWLLLVWCV